MSLGEAIITCLRRYATFTGRAGRHEFWYFQAVVLFLSGLQYTVRRAEFPIAALLLTIAAWSLLVPLLAVTVRRLHDTGRSGRWILLLLLPVIGTIVLLVLLAERSVPLDVDAVAGRTLTVPGRSGGRGKYAA